MCKALIIGSSNYKEESKRLPGSKEDVKAIGAFLRQHTSFGEEVTTKVDKSAADVDKVFNEEFLSSAK